MRNNIKFRLSLMSFLEFAVWGAYLTSMGSFLHTVGLDTKIWLFFSMQGVVSIFMPALIGILADRLVPAQRMLSLCHLLAGLAMFSAGLYAMASGKDISFGLFFTLYSVSIAFFMPTIAMSNSVAYHALETYGLDTVKNFPSIRMFGTVGFIMSMLFVNFMRDSNGVQFQNSYAQFLVSGTLSLVLSLYALRMPRCPVHRRAKRKKTFAEASGLAAFHLFRQKTFAVFFVFAALLGAALQITNGYANTFISSFRMIPEYADTWGARNANALISISQMSETLCILLIPFCLKRLGIKKVILISIIAWVFRFGLFGLGNPGNGVWMFILSCIVYGVAFDFFNISGSLFVDSNTSNDIRSSAQCLLLLMTNGIGATVGTWAAGKVVNHFVYNATEPSWSTAWFIFAGYALVLAILFLCFFRENDSISSRTGQE